MEYEKVPTTPGEHPSPSPRSLGFTRRAALSLGGAVGFVVFLAGLHHTGVTPTKEQLVDKTGELLKYAGLHRPKKGGEVKEVYNRKAKLESLYGMGKYEGRTWLDHIMSLDEDGLAPATKYTQKFLHEWQNPPIETCKDKLFYLMDMRDTQDWGHGLGSAIHVISYSLRNALDSGRIFAWHPEAALGRAFVEETSLDCLYVPATHCPQSVMTPENSVIGGAGKPAPNVAGIEGGYEQVPRVFQKELKRVLPFTYTTSALKYWWRSQASAYTMRMNEASLAHMVRTRMDAAQHEAFTRPKGSAAPTSIDLPWPLPAGTISMHIRHGNKAQEMSLHPLTDYVKAAERLISTNPNGYHKMAFLSSEDPAVFDEAKDISRISDSETTSNMDWLWYTSHIERLNSGPFEQLEKFGNRSETTLSWMSETMLAMECDGFVGTRGSNWNQILDALRCVWMDSCKHAYLDVGTDGDWDYMFVLLSVAEGGSNFVGLIGFECTAEISAG
ncbi:hypothetical protein MNV49_005478 [Pseudohyphozyma bogoriensis]|nr:hypothetical protein MNV49_005478 [Pseudohyphozyma bogoriensis]